LTILARLTGLCRDVFGKPNLAITESTMSTDIDGWDSMGHINLILAVESEFRVKFDTREIIEIDSIAELLALLQSRGIDDNGEGRGVA
jgi:acyl carrier protein